MNWQKHKRALKETINDIKDLTKTVLVIALGLGIPLSLVVLCLDYPLVGIPFTFLVLFSTLYLFNFRRN